MKVILSNMCLSLVGMLNPELGYHLEHRKNGFFAVRNNTPAPPDGHWRFIVLCAEMAQNGLHISDIQVSGYELKTALTEAVFLSSALHVDVDNEYNAAEVLQFKNELGL